jgi:hypothetical protein
LAGCERASSVRRGSIWTADRRETNVRFRRVPASEPDLARAAIETRLTDAWMSTIIEPLIAATGAGTIIDEEDLAA